MKKDTKYDLSKPIKTLDQANILFIYLDLKIDRLGEVNNREFISRMERTRTALYNKQQIDPIEINTDIIKTLDEANAFQQKYKIPVRCHDLDGEQFVRIMEDIRCMGLL